MIIGEKYVFIENPKTASTSISHALRSSGHGRNVYGKHIPLVDTRMLRRSEDDPRGRHIIACVVRNPFERMVSGWLHTTKRRQTFREWLRGDEWRCGPFDFKRTPQTAWTHQCTLIISFADLEAGFANFCDRAGLPRIKLDHKNASKPYNYEDELTDADREIIRDRFYPDFKRGYV